MNRAYRALASLLLIASVTNDVAARVSRDPDFAPVFAGRTWIAAFDFPPCFQWFAPEVRLQGTVLEVVQRVERSDCPGSHPGTSQAMPALPAGPHTFVYRQVTSTGVDVNPELRTSFIVRTGDSQLVFWPADPVALEPVDITIDDDTCHELKSPRFEDGGITIVRQYLTDNIIQCDGISYKRITLGAFPPGEYTVRLVDKPLGRPEVLRATAVLRVGTGPAVPQWRGPVPPETDGAFHTERDVSGVWTFRDRPADGLQLIHSPAPGTEDGAYSRVSLVWYTYDAQRDPVWYFADLAAAPGSFSGPLHALLADGTRRDVGTAALVFPANSETREGMFTVTIAGRTDEHVVKRLRWARAAWLPWQVPAR